MRATQIVHWPGKDVPSCDRHAAKLMALAGHMGIGLSATPCFEDKECTNCENGEKAELEKLAKL